MQRWLWVTQPRFWAQLQGGRLDHGLSVKWTCDEETRVGDVALLYRADMAKDIAHLFKLRSDDLWEDEHPTDPRKTAWYCEAELVHTLRQPLLLWDLREDQRLANWPALQVNFHGLAFDLPPPVWRTLLDLAHPLDRIDLRKRGGA